MIKYLFLLFTVMINTLFAQDGTKASDLKERASMLFENDSLKMVIKRLQIENALIKTQLEDLEDILQLQSKQKNGEPSVNDSLLSSIKYTLPVEGRKIIAPLSLEGIEISMEGKLVFQLLVDREGRVVSIALQTEKSTLPQSELTRQIEQRIRSTVRYNKTSGSVQKIPFTVDLRMN
jgi:hypothetical protein